MLHTLAAYVTARLDIRSQRGGTALEYAVIASAIAAVVVVAVFFLGSATNSNFECAGSSYANSTADC